ncbi:hypothetical protein Ocin01_17663 [Orchesella cincta]|uniref:Uncharacterized protein n=1 Tax=Orchesella cincta TaxID=48709 RepID=A0A1D2M7S6_ORCCI|nr:hypothetical protein Ocin01_17663 [Orchesella cincta]
MTQFGDNVSREGEYSDEEDEENSEEEASAKMGKLNLKDESESSDENTDECEEEEAVSEEKLSSVMKVAVEEHNKYRRRHGVPDMKPSEEV